MSEQRRARDPRQTTLHPPRGRTCRSRDVDEPPFLRPPRRTRVRRARRGWLGRTVIALQIAGRRADGRVRALGRLLQGRWPASACASRNVEVRGSRFLSEGEVRELLGPAVGENILGLDIDELKARLRASPWVADATVSRTLPDTLRVEVRERVAAGPGRGGAPLPDGRRRRR